MLTTYYHVNPMFSKWLKMLIKSIKHSQNLAAHSAECLFHKNTEKNGGCVAFRCKFCVFPLLHLNQAIFTEILALVGIHRSDACQYCKI